MHYSVQSVLIIKGTSFVINWIYDPAAFNKTYWLFRCLDAKKDTYNGNKYFTVLTQF
jgi:hypothetical protein